MKLLIDIPDEEYNRIKEWEDNITGYQTSLLLYRAVRNGIPYDERLQGDLKSVEALKAYAREVLCGNNPTNSLLIRMFDEIIDNAPPCNNLQQTCNNLQQEGTDVIESEEELKELLGKYKKGGAE